MFQAAYFPEWLRAINGDVREVEAICLSVASLAAFPGCGSFHNHTELYLARTQPRKPMCFLAFLSPEFAKDWSG